MAQKMITIKMYHKLFIFFMSVNIDNYHDKCQIFIYFKFKANVIDLSPSPSRTHKIFWRMLVTKQSTVAIDFHSNEKNTMEVNGYQLLGY